MRETLSESPRFEPTYAIKYRGTVADAQRAAADAVRQVHPGPAPFRVKTLEGETQESFGRERMLAGLTTYFGGFAWPLAGVGLYGAVGLIALGVGASFVPARRASRTDPMAALRQE